MADHWKNTAPLDVASVLYAFTDSRQCHILPSSVNPGLRSPENYWYVSSFRMSSKMSTAADFDPWQCYDYQWKLTWCLRLHPQDPSREWLQNATTPGGGSQHTISDAGDLCTSWQWSSATSARMKRFSNCLHGHVPQVLQVLSLLWGASPYIEPRVLLHPV